MIAATSATTNVPTIIGSPTVRNAFFAAFTPVSTSIATFTTSQCFSSPKTAVLCRAATTKVKNPQGIAATIRSARFASIQTGSQKQR